MQAAHHIAMNARQLQNTTTKEKPKTKVSNTRLAPMPIIWTTNYELPTEIGWLVITMNRISTSFQSSWFKKIVSCVCPGTNSPATTADPAPPPPGVGVISRLTSLYASRCPGRFVLRWCIKFVGDIFLNFRSAAVYLSARSHKRQMARSLYLVLT